MEIFSILHRIEAHFQALHAVRPAVMYRLGENPPFARVAYPNGDEYRIYEDGSTTKLIAGLQIPYPTCPHPEAISTLCVFAFFWKHRKRIPVFLLAVFSIVTLQMWLSLAGVGVNIIPTFAAVMNTTLIVLLAACVISFAILNFGRGLVIRLDKPDALSGLLEAGQITIYPDTLVMSDNPDEKPDIFAGRVRDAIAGQLPKGQYIVILSYRNPSGLIVRFPDTGSQEVFHRANLVKDIPGWQKEVADPQRFERETWEDYRAYIAAFCDQFAGWAQVDKMKQGSPLRDMLHTFEAAAKHAALILCLLFCSHGANADPIGAGSDVPVPAQGVFSSIPDSLKLEQYKADMLASKAAIGKEIAPRQQFVTWVFHNFTVPVLFFIGLLAFFFAKAAFKEGSFLALYGHHARKVVFCCAAGIAIYEIADIMVWSFFHDNSLWWGAIKSVVVAGACYYLVTWITPNPKPRDVIETGNALNQFPTQRQLRG